MSVFRTFALVSALVASGCAASQRDLSSVAEVSESPRPALADYNLDADLALGGYDPVSYFDAEGPVLGVQEHAARVRGVVYFFASEEHRQTFLSDPRRYEPAYGGWCAWAMAHGRTVDVDPTNFTIEEGVLRVFYRNALVDTREKWNAGDRSVLRSDAAKSWSSQSGEPLEHLARR